MVLERPLTTTTQMDNPYQAPRGEILTPTGGANPLTWKQILFSFQGRIPRRQFWGGTGILILGATPIVLVAILASNTDSGLLSVIAGLILIVGYIALLWASFALQIKRWHDRDKSGWWILIGMIPIIGFWAIIETGCLRGTEGRNSYGDDPT